MPEPNMTSVDIPAEWEEELRPLRTAGPIAAASIAVMVLMAISFLAAWRQTGYATALMLAGTLGSAAVTAAAMLYAARLRDTAARLRQVEEELQTFTWSVSHDLRAPLRTIDGFARELQLDPDSQLSPAANKSLARIRAGSWRMTALIDGLLTLARASSIELRRQQVDLSAIARSIASELADAHTNRDITFIVNEEMQTIGDPDLLRIVLDNLLRNAVKFTAKNDTARITVGVDRNEFFVRDDGAGFDADSADELFAPFQRLHPATEFEGSGIGLAIVRRIVERHGGTVRAEGSRGHGATFFFTLASNHGARA